MSGGAVRGRAKTRRFAVHCGPLLPATLLVLPFASLPMNVAYAQTVEQNPAPVVTQRPIASLPDQTLESSDDATPLGVDLRRIVIVDQRQSPLVNEIASDAVDVSLAGPLLQDAQFIDRLEPFVGQPLSPKLIFDIRAEVTLYFRQINRPLVAVTVPPQEISSGILRLEVLPFQVGETRAEGNQWTPDTYLLGNVRNAPGDEIASDKLLEDINWLNLNPYRNLGVVFEPGAKPGTTDIIIRSDERKPWTIYSGYRNSGSREDDRDRVFAGFNVANFPLIDHQLSYQVTASPDVVASGRVFDLDDTNGYVSHSLSYFAPLSYANGWRHKLRFEASYIETFDELTDPFTQSNRTFQFYGEYAVPLARRGTVTPEVYAAFDFKRQENEVLFARFPLSETTLDVVQLVWGIRGDFTTSMRWGTTHRDNLDQRRGTGGQGAYDLRLVFSPGGLNSKNDDAAFVAATGNPDASSRYWYLYGFANHAAPLGYGLSRKTEVAFQLSNQTLPSLEQFSYGGYNSVRGYLTNEASGDDGIVIRNDLVFPSFEMLGANSQIRDQLTPYAFVDFGLSRDRFSDTTSELASAGLGFDYQLDRNLSATLTYSRILLDGDETSAGDIGVFGAVTVRF